MTVEEFMEFLIICKVDPNSQIFIKEEDKEENYFKSSSFEYDSESGVLSINVSRGILSLKQAKNIYDNELAKKQDDQIKDNQINEMNNLETFLDVEL